LTDVLYNLLSTPRSGQYQLVLADGSRVWLNNVSSLRFPTTFTGKERVVELSGEAYFEVAKDAARPFIVKIGKESVEVLGTSFNIMAYPEEGGTQTTLVNGAVRVKTSGNTVELQRDEQARVNANGGLTVLRHVNAEDIASWRNGFFYFGRASFEAIMRQLARWYNIEVVYEGKVPQMEFGGKIDRELSLDELLKYLDKNQLHFRLEGRRLVVLSR
jgi:ferric-dicitrate binding protein FerR (iron transport regulator)